MAKKKVTRKLAKKKANRSRKPSVDSADGVRVGEEPVPGMRLRCICRGHQGTIGRIAWSPCGRFIASPSSDKTIRIWDAKDGKCLAVLEGHTDAVNSVAWSPNSEFLATGSEDNTLRLWKIATLELDAALRRPTNDGEDTPIVVTGEFRALASHSSYVLALAWSPDGKTLASASIDGPIVLWNIESFQSTELAGSEHTVLTISWAPTGRALASGHDDCVRIWEPHGFEVNRRYSPSKLGVWLILVTRWSIPCYGDNAR